MTREEAIKVIKNFPVESTGERKAVILAIQALEQEPCEDAISIDNVIEWLKNKDIIKLSTQEEIARKELRELPSVNSEKTGRWIPVSERLPEVNQRVLVTSYGRVCYAMMTSVDGNSGYPIFRLQDSLNERVICETTVHSEYTTSRIKAWMPLPAPYEPQESEDKE